MTKHFGFNYVAVDGWDDAQASRLGGSGEPDVFVTCIGKIIPPAFLANRIFLNAHPGLLPQNRGVDAFKWSVINGWPIGVTLHVIDEQIDAGRILRRQRAPIYPSDDLAVVALRAYQLECDLLTDFELWLQSGKNDLWRVDSAVYPLSKRRVSDDQDRGLGTQFEINRPVFVSMAVDLSIHHHPSDTLS